ncbi:PREDICTED: uncharacterized protein LOC109237547 [Nicotiana attenuata]|uniref:uncharacterized protein LOC109237547 n=1 Tax=Nicotiana attenuata TaxID=49451 RepID=UPI000905B283|nr:PREDICTED: uncharacterized protein LOC109237547 [Nicotiana attenuata]
MGKISQALNSHPKGAIPSDTVVKPKRGNNMGHAIAVITRSGRDGNVPTSSGRRLVDDDQVMQEEEISNNVVQPNEKVRIHIDDSVEETQEEVNPSRIHNIDIPEPVVQKAKAPSPMPQPPYRQRLAKQNDFVTKKQLMNFETIKVTHQVSAIVHSMAPMLEDPSAFTITCTIGSAEFAKALCILGIGQPRPTSMILQMDDLTMKRPLGVIEHVLVRVDKFILPMDFVILDCEVDCEVPIILGRPFLATSKDLCDVEAGELTFRVGDKNVVFHVCKYMRQPKSKEVCSFVDLVTDVTVDDTSSKLNSVPDPSAPSAPVAPAGQSEEPDLTTDTAEAVRGIFTTPATPRFDNEEIQLADPEGDDIARDTEMSKDP